MTTKNKPTTREIVEAVLEIAAATADKWEAEYVTHDVAPWGVGYAIRKLDKQVIITSLEVR